VRPCRQGHAACPRHAPGHMPTSVRTRSGQGPRAPWRRRDQAVEARGHHARSMAETRPGSQARAGATPTPAPLCEAAPVLAREDSPAPPGEHTRAAGAPTHEQPGRPRPCSPGGRARPPPRRTARPRAGRPGPRATGSRARAAGAQGRALRVTALKGKCVFGPFLSILVIKCQHKCLNVNQCPWMNKVQIFNKGMFLSLSTLVLCTNIFV
jgi:hypothetical protein